MSDVLLINGDMLKELTGLRSNSVDLILCDLPYGTTKCPWDIVIPFEKMWKCFHSVIKENGAIVLFGQEPFSSMLRMSNLREYKYDWYWEKERLTNVLQVKRRAGKTIEAISVFYKNQPTYNPQMIKYDGPLRGNRAKSGKLGELIDGNVKPVKEYVDTGWRYPTQLLHFQRDCLTSNLHPTQKPVALWVRVARELPVLTRIEILSESNLIKIFLISQRVGLRQPNKLDINVESD